MSKWRMVGVLIVVLAVAVPELLACGDKLLLGGRGTRFQRPKNVRAANVLIYATPTSAVASAMKKEKMESWLAIYGHRTTKVETIQKVSTIVSNGRFDVILTANGDVANVKESVGASPNAPTVIGIDDLLKSHSVLETIDKEVLQRDQKNPNLKKPTKR